MLNHRRFYNSIDIVISKNKLEIFTLWIKNKKIFSKNIFFLFFCKQFLSLLYVYWQKKYLRSRWGSTPWSLWCTCQLLHHHYPVVDFGKFFVSKCTTHSLYKKSHAFFLLFWPFSFQFILLNFLIRFLSIFAEFASKGVLTSYFLPKNGCLMYNPKKCKKVYAFFCKSYPLLARIILSV